MIAVAGEALVDAHLDGNLLRLFPGGGPFNTAVALARLGAPVRFLGAISRDALGQMLARRLRAAGVDTSGAVRVDDPTPLAIVDGTAIEASYAFHLAGTAHEALARDGLRALDDGVVALHVGPLAFITNPPGSAIAAFAEREADRRVLMLDPNVRPSAIADRDAVLRRFERVAAIADLVKLSDRDLDYLYPGSDPLDIGELLLGRGTGCVVVTHGASGAEARTSKVSASVAAPAVSVVDTVGAGDAFGAGLLAWLSRFDRMRGERIRQLRGDELESALAYATAAGAAQCTRASAWAPAAADVDRLLDRHERT